MGEGKFCPKCREDVPISEWTRNAARPDGLTGHCRSCHLVVTKESARRKRNDFLQSLGGRCVRCGFDDMRAIQVDHVKGRRGALRGNTSTARFFREVLSNPDKYQLLCANCNTIKRIVEQESVGNRIYKRNVPTEHRSRKKEVVDL